MRKLINIVEDGDNVIDMYTRSKFMHEYDPESITMDDYDKLNLPMEWSIYEKDNNGNTVGDISYGTAVLDFSTDVPDGMYEVTHYLSTNDTEGRARGVIVRNGYFVPQPTVLAIQKAVEKTGYHGTYIEQMNYNDKSQAFEVEIGS